MKMKTTSVRDWLASIMMVMMLFSQTAVGWANMTPQTHGQHMMLSHCSDKAGAATILKQTHCLQANCEHTKKGTGSCLSLCCVADITMLANVIVNVIPDSDIKLVNQSLISPLYGRATSVLERPPRQSV